MPANLYPNAKFGRPLKAFVLSELRRSPDFPAHQEASGCAAEFWTVTQIQEACTALSYDLKARQKHFFDNVYTGVIKGRSLSQRPHNPAGPAPAGFYPAGPSGAPIAPAGAPIATGFTPATPGGYPAPASPVATGGAPAPADEMTDDDYEAMACEDGEAMPHKSEDDDYPASAPEPASPGFEGRPAAELLAEIIAPASPHLTPHLAAMLPRLLLPLAEEAVKPHGVIAPAAPAGEAGAPVVNVVRWEPAYRAFGLKSNSGGQDVARAWTVPVPLCDYAGAPRIDADYAWQGALLAQLAACDAAGMKVFCHGPAGVGKTEGLEQYAARLHRPFFRISVNRGTEPPDILGQMLPAAGGGTVWKDGALSAAFRVPYAVILIDEISTMQPDANTIFQTALDTRRLYLPEGVLEAAQGIFICAADNTCGVGDDTGRYVGTNAMNVALLDRFDLRLAFDYLPATTEANMLSRKSRLPVACCRPMVDFANLTRQKAGTGALTVGISPRRLLAWSRLVKAGIASQLAFDGCIVNGTAPDDREIIMSLQTSSLASEHARIDAIAHGQAAPTSPAPAPAPAPKGPFGPSEDEPL